MLTAIGMMSGTSMDGIDAALLRTNGERIEALGPSQTWAYPDDFRRKLQSVLGRERRDPQVQAVERDLTRLHGDMIERFLGDHGLSAGEIDIVGFHGQTTLHRPAERLTIQLGDGAALAARLKIAVAWDFRSADVQAGGQGAPFVPLYHAALVRDLEGPVAVLNIGGVANVTWIGGESEIVAFDTGPGNGPMDDWMEKRFGKRFDASGTAARQGKADNARVAAALERAFFAIRPPKSLDRNDFTADLAIGLADNDGMATLAEITVASIVAAREHFPRPASTWVVCGGGRHNDHLMARLQARLSPARVVNADELGWNGDAVEAQAFGYLAVRVLRGMPLSLPTTTGVPYPMPGGRISRP